MSAGSTAAGRLVRFEIWMLPLATLVFFVATAPGYGIFRDELYYLACGQHLDWGYVDHPPMVALLAALARVFFGDSLTGLRLFPALAAAGTVLLVGTTAERLGGGRWARFLAQVLAATAPAYLSLFTIFSMNAFDVLVWAAMAWLAVRLLNGDDPKLWLAFGAVAGLGLQNKLDVGLLGAGLVAGLILARRFDVLKNRWLYLGGGLAATLFLPHVIWQATHGWPTREFVANAQSGKITVLGPLAFVGAQFLMIGPLACSLAFAGLGWLLFSRAARPARALGWAVVVVLAVFAFSVSKPYYFSPAFTLLFPAAGVAVEAWSAGRFTRSARVAALVAAASGLVFAPLAKPLLSADHFVRYAAAVGIAPGTDENHRLGRLPQFFADMHGWRELAQATAGVYAALPPEDKGKACVYANNYGQAGAIDFFGPALGLPPVVSGHNSYWLWGPGSCGGEVVLILGGDLEDHTEGFARVEPGAVFHCTDCMPYEDNLTIWVARGLKANLAEAWPAVKHYD